MALINILARLGIDSTSYQAGLKKAESVAQAAGRVMKNHLAQAFTVAAVTKFAHSVAKLTGNIKDFSDKFKTTREDAQLIMRAAQDSGVSAEQIGEMINRMDAARAKVAAGNTEAVKSFTDLGIAIGKIGDDTVSSFELVQEVIQKTAQASDPIAARGASLKLLGESSGKLAAAVMSVHSLGPMVLLTDDQIERVDRAAKKVFHLRDDMDKLGGMIAGNALAMYESKAAGQGALGKTEAALMAPLVSFFGTIAWGLKKDQTNKTFEPLSVEDALEDRKKKKAAQTEFEERVNALMAAHNKASKTAQGLSESAKPASAGGVSVSDPLAKIGGLFFGADAGMRAIPQRQLDELRRLNARVERIERAATSD